MSAPRGTLCVLPRWPKRQVEGLWRGCNSKANGAYRLLISRLLLTSTSIHNTERNLDLASNQNRLAAEKAREIKTLNVSYCFQDYKLLCMLTSFIEIHVRSCK